MWSDMEVYGLNIPERGLTNLDLYSYVHELGIPDFRGVYMRDTLPKIAHLRECGIVNLNTSQQPGSHWVCYFKDGERRLHVDTFGQVTLYEVQKYLKSKKELETGAAVIQRNTDIVQRVNTHVCGHICLFVLTSLAREHLSFQDVLNRLNDVYSRHDW